MTKNAFYFNQTIAKMNEIIAQAGHISETAQSNLKKPQPKQQNYLIELLSRYKLPWTKTVIY